MIWHINGPLLLSSWLLNRRTPKTPERRDIRDAGVNTGVLILAGRVVDAQCGPIAGAVLDFWQTDHNGIYDNQSYRYRGHQYTSSPTPARTGLPARRRSTSSSRAADGRLLMTTLVWIHAGLFGALALASYVSPETVFGPSAWLQLPRMAAQLFAAALVACAIVLIGSARSRSAPHMRLALLAAVVVDVQVPILSFSQPAALEHFEHDLGIPWFIVPLLFAVVVAVTVPLLTRRAVAS